MIPIFWELPRICSRIFFIPGIAGKIPTWEGNSRGNSLVLQSLKFNWSSVRIPWISGGVNPGFFGISPWNSQGFTKRPLKRPNSWGFIPNFKEKRGNFLWIRKPPEVFLDLGEQQENRSGRWNQIWDFWLDPPQTWRDFRKMWISL